MSHNEINPYNLDKKDCYVSICFAWFLTHENLSIHSSHIYMTDVSIIYIPAQFLHSVSTW